MARYEDNLKCGEGEHKLPEVAESSLPSPLEDIRSKEPCMSQSRAACSSPIRANQALPSLAAKRKTASEFIKALTGTGPPYATDQAFRAALKDGVLFCKLANAVWPGVIKHVMEAGEMELGPAGLLAQQEHNLQAFLAALHQVKQLPSECMFSIADLEAEHEERPQVANCLLFIRTIAFSQQMHSSPYTQSPCMQQGAHSSAHDSMVTPPPQRGCGSRLTGEQQHSMVTPPSVGSIHTQHGPGTRLSFAGSPSSAGSFAPTVQARYGPSNQHLALPLPAGSPLIDARSSLSNGHGGSMVCYRSNSGSLTPASTHGGSITAAHHKSVQAAAGVTKLMQQCTHMLKERMFPVEHNMQRHTHGGATPDTAMKALGPVLEGVLGQLTEEYERRLLSKDHELNKALEAALRAEEKLQRIQEKYEQLQVEAEERSRAATRASEECHAADAAELVQQLHQAQAALAATEAELAQARSALSSADTTRLDAYHALQNETLLLRTRLGELLPIEEKYKAVLLENRELYNTVQDLRGNIRVFCRIRPPGATGDLSPSCVDVGLEGDLAVYEQASGTKRVFKVDRVFDQNMDQTAVYSDTQPLIRSVLDGYNVCIFAYGQTGSGKTHTMSGTNTTESAGRGINYRALDDLFSICNARPESEYTFRVQMLEIYNENLRDLLTDGKGGAVNKLDILATQASGCNVPGATQVEVQNASDVVMLMAKGASQRATSETKMNDRSSRSHQILTVIVDGFNTVTKAASHGCLHLIDLAGSERVGKSEASGDRLVEAQHINKSLSALGDVMAALASKTTHVPYRNSKLTQLLQDSLQGNAKVMMFMHISPEANMFSESVSTLKFATRVSQITLGQAKKNVVSGKVFEAHEEMMKTQKTIESKEQQMQQTQAALEHHRNQEARLREENEQLRQQLRQMQHQPALNSNGEAAAPQRSQLHLPLQQMLVQQQQATLAALSSRGGHSEAVNVSPVATAGSHSAFAPGATDSPARRGSRHVDKTPPRDQDELSLASEPSHATLEPLYFASEGPDPTPPRTARSTRSTQGSALRESYAQHSREHASATRHAERLATARQSGQYRGSASSHTSTAAGAAAQSPAATLSQLLNKGLSKVGGLMTHGSAATSRTKDVDRGPQTSRVSGVVRNSRASEVSHIPSFSTSTTTSRQSGVYNSKHGSTSGAVTARPAATARGGSRWK